MLRLKRASRHRTEKKKNSPPPALSRPPPRKPQGTVGHPRKRFYRARAHANPLSDGFYADLPDSPKDIDWEALYREAFAEAREKGEAPPLVTVADVGCGFGGLLTKLSPLTPRGELLVGLELRSKVCDYVRQRAAVARARAAAAAEEGGGEGGERGEEAATAAATADLSSTAAAATAATDVLNAAECRYDGVSPEL